MQLLDCATDMESKCEITHSICKKTEREIHKRLFSIDDGTFYGTTLSSSKSDCGLHHACNELSGWHDDCNTNGQRKQSDASKDSSTKTKRVKCDKIYPHSSRTIERSVFHHHTDIQKYIYEYREEHRYGRPASAPLTGHPYDLMLSRCKDYDVNRARLAATAQRTDWPSSPAQTQKPSYEPITNQELLLLRDASLMYKYKFAPVYVNNLLQQRNGPNSQKDSSNKNGKRSKERESSAKQTIQSRASGNVNLTPTKITISSLLANRAGLASINVTGTSKSDETSERPPSCTSKSKGRGSPISLMPYSQRSPSLCREISVSGERVNHKLETPIKLLNGFQQENDVEDSLSLAQLSTTCLGMEHSTKPTPIATNSPRFPDGLNIGMLMDTRFSCEDWVNETVARNYANQKTMLSPLDSTRKDNAVYAYSPPKSSHHATENKAAINYTGNIAPSPEHSKGGNSKLKNGSMALRYIKLVDKQKSEAELVREQRKSLESPSKSNSAVDIKPTIIPFSEKIKKASKSGLQFSIGSIPYCKFWGEQGATSEDFQDGTRRASPRHDVGASCRQAEEWVDRHGRGNNGVMDVLH